LLILAGVTPLDPAAAEVGVFEGVDEPGPLAAGVTRDRDWIALKAALAELFSLPFPAVRY
jgi:hypothetical protein